MYRRAATIPSFLSVSPRTVAAHVHNLMLKLECNSREGIIDFVEQSGNASVIKEHYQSLAVDVLFEKCLREIANLIRNQSFVCTIWFEPNDSASRINIIHKLIKHIKVAGLDAILKRKVGEGFSYF
ncbi:MAG: LuxR C-terminal-related transcriptional regulator, partial [Pseudomonadota bacterium]|nr:LuxR C-terminal-related transcriptional regulator [Pseudomonadota bacterium]